MKHFALILIGALMFAAATCFHVFGPPMSNGEETAVAFFGLGGAYAFVGGLIGLLDEPR